MSVAAALPGTEPESSFAPVRDLRSERVLRVRAAGFGRRVVAVVLDGVMLVSLTAAVALIVGIVLGAPLPRPRELGPDLLVAGLLDRSPLVVGALGLFAGITVLYELYCAGIAGQTLGMRVAGIRLISSRGTRPGVIRGIVRVAAFAVSVLPGALGWLWAMFDPEHRALHDHLSGTYVILDGV